MIVRVAFAVAQEMMDGMGDLDEGVGNQLDE